ncbi:MAG: hypothetical protein UZ05_CHB002000217 [Chlorobi bacterium OLB5]|nr:MAG: hypothetical protein UZ05_CHB002000217 [Chlorobi bacterium OLB5]
MEPTTPPPAPTETQQEDLSLILKIVSFCIPLVGAILWFINKDKNPKAAKSACTFALIGVAVGIIINVIVTVLGGLSS